MGKATRRWWCGHPTQWRPLTPSKAEIARGRALALLETKKDTTHGGVPVGALLTPAASLAEIRLAIESCTGCALRLRGVEPLPFQLQASPSISLVADADARPSPSAEAISAPVPQAPPRQLMAVCAHLPPEAAALIESGGLDTLLATHGATYYPGVRPMDNLFQGLCDGLEDEEKGGNESSKSDALAEVGEDRKIASSVNISTAAHMSSSNSLRSTATTSTTSSNSAHPPLPPPPAASFTFAEIFAGIGGFRLGLEPLGGRCVLMSDVDRGAVDTYVLNFGGVCDPVKAIAAARKVPRGTKNGAATSAAAADAATTAAAAATNNSTANITAMDTADSKTTTTTMKGDAASGVENSELIVGDISEYPDEALPSFDVLTAGFPCQPFSVRGTGPGLQDPKGQLFRELVRLLRKKRPKAFLFENVAGLVTGDGGSRRAVSPDGVDGGDVGHESTLDNRAADIEIDNDNGGTNHSSGSAGSSTAVSSATHRSNSNSNETESASTNQEQQPQQQPPQQKRRWPGAGQKTIFEAGRTFQHILDSFAAEGYDVSWQVVSARHWLPQNRERVFITGIRSDLGASPVDWKKLELGDETATVRTILEPSDSAEVQEATMTSAQWATVRSQVHAKKIADAKKKEQLKEQVARGETSANAGGTASVSSVTACAAAADTTVVSAANDGALPTPTSFSALPLSTSKARPPNNAGAFSRVTDVHGLSSQASANALEQKLSNRDRRVARAKEREKQAVLLGQHNKKQRVEKEDGGKDDERVTADESRAQGSGAGTAAATATSAAAADTAALWLECSRTRSLELDGKAATLTSGYHGGGNLSTRYLFHDHDGLPRDGLEGRPLPRFLTPRECARVMGFPDYFHWPNAYTAEGRGRFYKQAGNAVCPPVVKAVATLLLDAIHTPEALRKNHSWKKAKPAFNKLLARVSI